MKIRAMKNQILIKALLLLPIIVLADYIFMALLGCTACLSGLGDSFYCGSYCLIGKGIMLLSLVLFFYLFLPDIKKILTRKPHGQAS